MPDVGAVESKGAGMVERVSETRPQSVERVLPSPKGETSVPAAPLAAPIIPALPRATTVVKTPLREDIEDALADGLESAYAALAPDAQAKFRQVGEALASMLEAMVSRGELDLRKTHQRILDWLRILPTRGKFFAYFLMQEAKVKTDAILALARRSRGSS